VVPAFKRAADAIAANPEKSNRQIAEETGVSVDTVNRARKSGERCRSPDDRSPSIKPLKGAGWDDQDDRVPDDRDGSVHRA
jgi:hypothetical protein